jgi:Na+-transporting methylmalonyl-CoA/oxaloacetate decarboxylase gamma subunit
MVFLAVTSQTWLVTCLGFALVLVLLFVFVYIMKGLGWIMQAQTKTTKPSDKPADVNNKPMTATQAASGDEAAVAYALHLYYNSLHDMESPRLTVRNHATAWHIIQ